MTLDDCYGTHWYCLLLTVCIRILDICAQAIKLSAAKDLVNKATTSSIRSPTEKYRMLNYGSN